MSVNYYNEIDAYKAEWLRNLISERLIPQGDVDERSITEVDPHDLNGYRQCHFFAGIAGWSCALALAGWPDERECWTGSCPCQPFSIAGQVFGVKDKRHLWPEWFRLIRARKPPIVFGEQVAGAAGYQWIAGVHLEMESAAYSFGAANLSAASVKAKHPRQRLFFVAHADGAGLAGSLGARSGLRLTTAKASTEFSNLGLRSRICFKPDPRALVRIDGLPRPVGQVCAFGDALVPQIAAEFIMAAMESVHDRKAI